MKSIQLSYSDVNKMKHLKMDDIVIVEKLLGFTTFMLTNGDVVESKRDGRFVSQVDGYSTYEEVFVWDSEEEMKTEPLGFIRTM